MSPLLALVALAPVLSTLTGGLVALRFRHRLHPAMAFAAGVLLATAALDLLPESWALLGAGQAALVGVFFLAGLLGYTALEALVEQGSYEHAERRHGRGALSLLGPTGLIIHSGLDGTAIGLGFATNSTLGLLVAAAVIAHDFADGLNVVTLALSSGAGHRGARAMLLIDAAIVPIGVLFGANLGLDPQVLGLALGVFAGVFVAIGAGHLLPEARHEQPGATPTFILLALAGAALVALVRMALS